ncbi:ciliary-associated calcium-binding coiled-coil protein 1 isoform X3 [Varanus komodoensis]|uniref:ciliary-associated calcium-binding coiled-coil protein 1 isoform X3 n=1 Tax=Varanus komodoensis TaxID=61221 RepID=UPI001CF7D1B5|nr:ciliary-associated calcium-binding coiled-coil protein 1 isoform X3 [Varanus komodoensis]
MAAKEKDKAREKEPESISAQEEDKMEQDEVPMAWNFLSFTQVSILLEQDIAGVQKSLEEFLNLKERLTSLKEAVLLDYYVSGFWWAKALEFTPVQIGGFLTLLNLLLENLDTQHMTLQENIQELGNAMAGIGQSHSDRSGGFEFFTVDQAHAIINYLKISLFQHYTLYEYLFHSLREELVIGDEVFRFCLKTLPRGKTKLTHNDCSSKRIFNGVNSFTCFCYWSLQACGKEML